MFGHLKTTFIFFLFIYLTIRYDASEAPVSITIYNDREGVDRLKCTSKAVLTCSIPNYGITMTWTIDGNIVADCIWKKCATYSNNYKHYDFSFDTSKGIFNITINPVSFADNGNRFKCDEGTQSSLFIAKVDVIPDSSETSILPSSEKQFTEIRVTTGCFYPSSGIQLEWYYFKVGQTPKLYIYNQSIQSTTEDGCTIGPCGGKGIVKITNTLTINEVPNGDEFYFQVLIKHPDTTDSIFNAGRPFKLNGNPKHTTPAVGDAINNGKIATLNISTITLCLIMKIF